MDILKLIGRDKELFSKDIRDFDSEMKSIIENNRFLVLGGAGSIGKAVVKELFERNPLKLHVVDISENNLAELVRDLRSSYGYIDGDFQTFSLDIGSSIYDAFIESDGKYDYVLNLSALKHVRSEKDSFTMMRMIEVNIFNTLKTAQQAIDNGAKKYFCVSTDKAANPVNIMGATKRLMEIFLLHNAKGIKKSMARFANVAFSDGSLLHSFEQRLKLNQPIVAPDDVKRYFVTPKESGILCLMSCLFGEDGDIFFPKLTPEKHLVTFVSIAEKFLTEKKYNPYLCSSEQEARENVEAAKLNGQWPCYFSPSDTTGEKDFEEFFMDDEEVILDKFDELGIVQLKNVKLNDELIDSVLLKLKQLFADGKWDKEELVALFKLILPELTYFDKMKYLDSKM